jgi:hypothetical protein
LEDNAQIAALLRCDVARLAVSISQTTFLGSFSRTKFFDTAVPVFLVTGFQMGQIGDLPRVTYEHDMERCFEQGHQDIEIVASKILHFVNENERVDA